MWNVTDRYQKVAEANRKSYNKRARKYDRSETCVRGKYHQCLLDNDLDTIFELLDTTRTSKKIRALDACGGSGNVAIKLLQRGADVVVCDVSREMLNIFEQRCSAMGFSAITVCDEIGNYLITTSDSFDLIVFSSALHHLENYTQVYYWQVIVCEKVD